MRLSKKAIRLIEILINSVSVISGILAVVFVVIVLINADKNIFYSSFVLIFAAIMNLLLAIKLYLSEEYQKFLIRLIIGVAIFIIGLILFFSF